MALTFDGPTKRITLSAGTTTLIVPDLWSRWVDWVLTGENSKFLPAMRSVGGDPIDAAAGTSIPVYTYLINGWKVVPQSANHTLNVTGGILLVDGGGDPFASPAGGYNIRVNFQQPVQAIAVSTTGGGSSGGLTADQELLLRDIAKIHGLIPGTPLVVGPTTRQAGDIAQTVTENAGVVTVTRS
jgi:hypothetical protein